MSAPRLLLCCLILSLLIPALAVADPGTSGGSPSRLYLGTLVGTWAGPSHADLLFRTNDIMQSMGSDFGVRISDFDSSTPLGLRLYWSYRPALGFSATYSLSNYSSAQTFNPHGWSTPRELKTRLHEVGLAVHYGLDFVRSHKLLPYIGVGFGVVYADSDLSIDLLNVNGVTEDSDDPDSPLRPDARRLVSANDTTLAYFGLAGLIFHLNGRIALNAEMQGIMGDLRQTFDYAGSMQHIAPGSEPEILESWNSNDILGGVYPLDLNGVRLSIGILVGI